MARALLAAEFADHVVRARRAVARHVRVEQERPPGELEQEVRPAAEGPQQAADAEVAPRANEVVDDVDLKAGFRGCQDVHGRSLPRGELKVTLMVAAPSRCRQ